MIFDENNGGEKMTKKEDLLAERNRNRILMFFDFAMILLGLCTLIILIGFVFLIMGAHGLSKHYNRNCAISRELKE